MIQFCANFGAILLAALLAWLVIRALNRHPDLHLRVLRAVFPQRDGRTHPWDAATCYRCGTERVELVTVDHNGDIQQMACTEEHCRPWARWSTVRLDPPVLRGSWAQVERAVEGQLAGAQ